MSIGGRNKLLTVQENTASSQDGAGHIAPSWVDRAEMWCKIEPLDGSEVRRSEALLYENPVQVSMRWDSRIADMEPTAWRLKRVARRPNGATTTIYDIVSAANVAEADVEFRLLCTTGSGVPA